MILLEVDLPEPLLIGQASFKSYLPDKKIVLYWTTGRFFLAVHLDLCTK